MEFNKISLEVENNIGIMRFNDPDVRNAVSPDMLEGFWECLNEIEKENSEIKCLLITGEGKGFCAGANLSSGSERSNSGRQDAGHALETLYHPILRRLRNMNIPIVTAVNGAAAGIGMSFALMGDIILASKSAFFLQAFRRIGLVPDGGSTWLLPRLVGNARAKELSLLGERLPAEKAYEWGLINRLVDEENLIDEALKISKELSNGPMSLKLIRKAFWESSDNTYEEQLNLERELQFQAGNSEDFKEGVKAFLDKRDAKFKGK
ncbi:MAG: enoyl-CoA hydratase/isomerase [Pseudomonadota bacterium]|nr:enoyl-CoA hydratase/isomerase [Pseudomonadota bacterium]MEC7830649.1 enoyl-CoA hydratase/isomerase [Pseudomonadota bacterium]MEC9382617.1 enoyl-CoA hydratase/isomerase [Pseudomonadota bacterium]MEC9414349.1 enoyl-CoA hydratase/isomerase [Pseudomonadota bacterium]MEC9481373.1 enoyl-CoA hydratase/isomerase [Pseudomonadota bacterium]